MSLTSTNLAIWVISALVTGCVLVRPFKWPEAVWAVSGAVVIVAFRLLPFARGAQAVAKGLDVYLFLIGMMLLSETARQEGLFDRVATLAVNSAKSSPKRLFTLIYGVGVVITVFLSNDAAAVVLTPAVYAATKKAKVDALPYLLICAFIANAASFVLPISNPANIVLYGDHTPPLGRWVARFFLPSAASIAATYVVLRGVEASRLGQDCACDVPADPMSPGAWAALGGIVVTGAGLMAVSMMDMQLGLPTCLFGSATTGLVLVMARGSPWTILKGVSWAILPLVAGLFVLVEALSSTGVISALGFLLSEKAKAFPLGVSWASGGIIALVSNLMNNLPAGLIASSTVAHAHPPPQVVDALLIGVDVGPNLSVTGSLATILWLGAIRREGMSVGFWRFLRLGALAMPPALILALAARLLLPN